MKIVFWGVKGSLPSSIRSENVRAKVKKALRTALSHGLSISDDLDAFIDDNLPFPVKGTYGINTSCIEIIGGDEYVVCDAGSGLRDFGNDSLSRGGIGKAYNIFLSHPHWDHIQGFPFFTPSYIPGRNIRIYGCHENLAEVFATQQKAPYFPVDLSQLGGNVSFITLKPDRNYRIAGLDVRAKEQNHPGKTYGYSFEKDGKKFVYSTDCEHKTNGLGVNNHFHDFFRNSDLLIMDTQYTYAESVTHKEDWGHSSNIVAVELAKAAGVKKLCLFHHEPTLSDDKLDAFLKETIQYESLIAGERKLDIVMAYDGLEISI